MRPDRCPIPVIDGMFRIPTRLLVGRVDLQALKKELTADYFDQNTGLTTKVKIYKEARGWFIVPRSFGRERFPDLWRRAKDRTIRRPFKIKLPIRIKPRDADQQAFVDGLVALFSDNVIDAQANAATGSGKTASACMMQARLGKRMLVIVHQNRLKEGWLGNAAEGKGLRFFYGDEWVSKNVGVCQQEVCNYQGKAIVIAMAPSLCNRTYPKEFYESFDIVVIDELHKMATPVLNQVLGMFPARAHIGLTATPKEGAMAKVIKAHVGDGKVISKQEVRQPIVCRIRYDEQIDFVDNNGDPIDNRNALITRLSRSRKRQDMLADIIFYRGYARNRECLVLSDRTDQLLDLRKRLIEAGVSEDEIGMYVGKYRTGKTKLTGKLSYVDPKTGKVTALHFRGIKGFASKKKAHDYVQQQIKRLAKDKGIHAGSIGNQSKLSAEMHSPSVDDYNHIEKTARIVLATYGIFDTGIDIKRLDWGLEASMRGDVAQAVGRILRLMDGKPVPEWYSVYDVVWTILERIIMGEPVTKRYEYSSPKRLEKQRRASYAKQNAIQQRIDNPDEAIKKAKEAYRFAVKGNRSGSEETTERKAA